MIAHSPSSTCSPAEKRPHGRTEQHVNSITNLFKSKTRRLTFISYPFAIFYRNGSVTTVSSGSVFRRTATTRTPRSSTGTTGPVAIGTWPSTSEGKPKWALVHGSNLSTSPPTSCPGSAWTTGASEASPSQTGAKRDAKSHRRLPNLQRGGQTYRQEVPPNARKSSTGPSTGSDS